MRQFHGSSLSIPNFFLHKISGVCYFDKKFKYFKVYLYLLVAICMKFSGTKINDKNFCEVFAHNPLCNRKSLNTPLIKENSSSTKNAFLRNIIFLYNLHKFYS